MVDLESIEKHLDDVSARALMEREALLCVRDVRHAIGSLGLDVQLAFEGGRLILTVPLTLWSEQSGVQDFEIAVDQGNPEVSGDDAGAEPISEAADGAAQVPAADYKTGAFSDSEDRMMLALHAAGASSAKIAKKLGRKTPGVAMHLKAVLAAEGADGEEAVVPAAPQDPAPATSSPQVAEAGAGRDRSIPGSAITSSHLISRRGRDLTHSQMRAAVLRVQSTDEIWTPAMDLQLAERVIAGDGIGAAAEAVEVDRPAALARWRQLMPDVTLHNQEMLLIVLRERLL